MILKMNNDINNLWMYKNLYIILKNKNLYIIKVSNYDFYFLFLLFINSFVVCFIGSCTKYQRENVNTLQYYSKPIM